MIAFWQDHTTPFLRKVLIGSLFLAIILLVHIARYPSYGDTFAYREYAGYFRQYGFLSDFGSVRTYGYPAFLYLVSFVTGTDQNRMAMGAGAVQYALFIAASLWLLAQIRSYGTRLHQAAALGLLLNPLVLALVVDTLSESLTIILAIASFASLLAACRATQWKCAAAYLGLANTFGFYAMMVRPANIIMVLALLMGTIFFILSHPTLAGKRWKLVLGCVACLTISAAVIFGPQLAYNLHQWQTATILPVCQLNEMQMTYSVLLLKCEALAKQGVGAMGRYYLNPWLYEPLPMQSAWRWYLQHPLRGMFTMAMHIFTSFDARYLHTYIYDSKPFYGVTLSVGVWSLNILGSTQLFLMRQPMMVAIRRRQMPAHAALIVFLAALFLGTMALNAITGVEVRFNTLPLAILAVLGLYWVLPMAASPTLRQLGVLAGSVLLASIIAGYSVRLESLATDKVPEGLLQFDQAGHRCFDERSAL